MGDVVSAPSRRFTVGSLMLGFGFGGLADGIILHQVLQWHNLITQVETNQTLEGLQRNLFWDGVFHMSTAGLTAIAILVLWGGRGPGQLRQEPVRRLAGLALIGWGAFHVVDQFVFHLALDLHNIRDGVENPDLYNWSFFGVGIVLAVVGWGAVRSGRQTHAASSGALG